MRTSYPKARVDNQLMYARGFSGRLWHCPKGLVIVFKQGDWGIAFTNSVERVLCFQYSKQKYQVPLNFIWHKPYAWISSTPKTRTSLNEDCLWPHRKTVFQRRKNQHKENTRFVEIWGPDKDTTYYKLIIIAHRANRKVKNIPGTSVVCEWLVLGQVRLTT